MDAVGLEVAGFDIGCTLVEPGAARTDFRYRSAQLSRKLDAYDASPARAAHRIVEERTSIPIGDAAKMVAIMIASADQHPAPKRIALGSDAYNVMHKQLSDRLAALEAQKALAFSTDFGPGI